MRFRPESLAPARPSKPSAAPEWSRQKLVIKNGEVSRDRVDLKLMFVIEE